MGGIGRLCGCFVLGGVGRGLSSNGASVDDGRVDVELKRAEVDEASFWPPLDAEWFVPPLPLPHVNTADFAEGIATIYRLPKVGPVLDST